MSLYNMIFDVNDFAGVLLLTLGYIHTDIPRFRDCFLHNGKIVIHTRTGGGNRDYYESEETCRRNYPEYWDKPDECPQTTYNDSLRKHPNFLYDEDSDFDCTYANFFYSFPEDYRTELELLAKHHDSPMPSEKWKTLFKDLQKSTNQDNEEDGA